MFTIPYVSPPPLPPFAAFQDLRVPLDHVIFAAHLFAWGFGVQGLGLRVFGVYDIRGTLLGSLLEGNPTT